MSADPVHAPGPAPDPGSPVPESAVPESRDPEDTGAGPEDSDVPWQRLDIRLVWVNTAKLAASCGTGLAGFLLFPGGVLWPLLLVAAWGVVSTGRDFVRWVFTRYRVTDERVERRTGWLMREFRFVQRDRIRSVSSSAKLRHRLVALRVIHIGTGQATHVRSTFKLDALDRDASERLRRELLPDDQPDPREGETVISRIRWSWLLYNVVHIWAVLSGGLFVVSTYFSLDAVGIDLIDVLTGLYTDVRPSLWAAVGVAVGTLFVLGVGALAADFVAKHWNFELVRATGADGAGTALLTRRGLFTTHTVHRDQRRIRGVHLVEPLVWRWMRLTETKVITTGLTAGLSESADLLPRAPRDEALHVARAVFDDGRHPLEEPLVRHPPGALRRRLLWATYGPAAIAGILWWLGDTGVVATTAWRWPLYLLPVAWALAVVAYRSLGHALVGPYLVVRSGAVNRSTTVLLHGAVIGWRVHQSIFQRFGRRLSIGIPTAAGSRYYELHDAGVDQGLDFISSVNPELAAQFLTSVGEPSSTDSDATVATGSEQSVPDHSTAADDISSHR